MTLPALGAGCAGWSHRATSNQETTPVWGDRPSRMTTLLRSSDTPRPGRYRQMVFSPWPHRSHTASPPCSSTRVTRAPAARAVRAAALPAGPPPTTVMSGSFTGWRLPHRPLLRQVWMPCAEITSSTVSPTARAPALGPGARTGGSCADQHHILNAAAHKGGRTNLPNDPMARGQPELH